MKARWAHSGLLVSVALQLGCDARAGSDYEGESLLSIEGNVVFADPVAPSELVPAIAFRDSTQLYILDVEVRGHFPANFRLDVLDRPPPETFHDPANYYPIVAPDEPRFAVAYIAAVSPEHPERIPLSIVQGRGFSCDGPQPPPPGELPENDPDYVIPVAEAGATCIYERRACTLDGSACATRVERCDHRLQSCEIISQSGDPDLFKTSAGHFAGLSSNYLLLYLERQAPAGSVTARTFGDGEALPAGYHLIEARDYTRAELDDKSACWLRAQELALPPYNAAHGTNYLPGQPSFSFEEASERDLATFPTGMELNCPIGAYSFKNVERPRRRKISIVVGASEAPPYLWGPLPAWD